MRWSKARLEMLVKLQQMERARRSEAEARLASAAADHCDARVARDEANAALAQAERGWVDHHQMSRFDLDLARMLGAQLLERERELGSREAMVGEAKEQEEKERSVWRMLETRVRSGDEALTRGRRLLTRRAEGRADQEISDRTTWRWFRR